MGLLSMLLLAAAGAAAQFPPANPPVSAPAPSALDQPPLFRAGVTLVRVDVQVVDRSGRKITGLEQSDFLVYDENQPRAIAHFGREFEPVDLLLLLDVSGSMRRALDQMAAAARAALGQLLPDDRVAVMLFARRAEVREQFTSSKPAVEEEIRRAVRDQSLGGGTVINGSIIEAAHYIGAQPRRGRRALLILTDNESVNYQVPDEDVVKALWQADTALNAIVTGRLARPAAPRDGAPRNPDFTPSDVVGLARRSGGEAIEARHAGESFREMIERIRARYSLDFEPAGAAPGSLRRIRVELSAEARRRYPDAAIHARQGYFAQ
jgi:VWFA-related protein